MFPGVTAETLNDKTQNIESELKDQDKKDELEIKVKKQEEKIRKLEFKLKEIEEKLGAGQFGALIEKTMNSGKLDAQRVGLNESTAAVEKAKVGTRRRAERRRRSWIRRRRRGVAAGDPADEIENDEYLHRRRGRRRGADPWAEAHFMEGQRRRVVPYEDDSDLEDSDTATVGFVVDYVTNTLLDFGNWAELRFEPEGQ